MCEASWATLYRFLTSYFFDLPKWKIIFDQFNAGEVNESDNGNYGASAHSDYGMMTLLATDGIPGLQVCHLFFG